jgi:hypothetical protein
MGYLRHINGKPHGRAYAVAMPLATHWGPATCEDVDCEAYILGWATVLPVGSDHIEVLKKSGRSYTEERQEGGLIKFTFPPGQPCFKASTHWAQTGRPGLYVHGARDEIERVPQSHRSAHGYGIRPIEQGEWHERFAENLEHLARERGQEV